MLFQYKQAMMKNSQQTDEIPFENFHCAIQTCLCSKNTEETHDSTSILKQHREHKLVLPPLQEMMVLQNWYFSVLTTEISNISIK